MNGLGKDSVTYLEVDEEGAGQRLDNFLMRIAKGVPKSHIYRIVRSGQVRANGKRVPVDYRLQPGDRIRIPPIKTASLELQLAVPPRDFSCVFEDPVLTVIDKPSGVAVHGGSGVSFGVIEQLRRARTDCRYMELVHRLDRETSGLLMVAKKRSALTRLHEDFRSGGISKRYLALVKGRWMNPTQHIRTPLHKYLTNDGERRVRVDEAGKAAHSIVRLLVRWSSFSLVEVEIKTGRTHQIRVHLAHLGFPLCGDEKYGDFALNRELHRLGLKRMFLHAKYLCFVHPISGQEICLEAPLPEELTTFISYLDTRESREYGATL